MGSTPTFGTDPSYNIIVLAASPQYRMRGSMANETRLVPSGIVAEIDAIVRGQTHSGQWIGARWLWSQLQVSDPTLARKIIGQSQGIRSDVAFGVQLMPNV